MSKETDLAQARETIVELTAMLEKLGEGALEHGTILAERPGFVTIAKGSALLDIAAPLSPAVHPGDSVLISGHGLIVAKLPKPILVGDEAVIARVVGDAFEIERGGNTRLILKGLLKDSAKEGDTVLLDTSGMIALSVVPQAKPAFALEADTGVVWAHIGGQEEAKLELREAIELPRTHPEIFKAYGHRPAKGVLLSGPPGCGKTMLGKACASAMAGSGPSAFMFVKGPEVLDPYVGVAEATVRALFQKARAHKAAHGTNAVIFIDEAEALLGSRSGRYNQMERTIVPAFLAEMDGIEESGALVILATNKPEALDSAIVRDGRIDRKVRVGRPSKDDATAIFELNLKGCPLQGSTVPALAGMASEYLYFSTHIIFHVRTKCGSDYTLTLGHTVSGAMVAGIVGKAKSVALRRDLAAGGKPKGIAAADLIEAIDQTLAQSANLDHDDDIVLLTAGREVASLRRPTPTTEASPQEAAA